MMPAASRRLRGMIVALRFDGANSVLLPAGWVAANTPGNSTPGTGDKPPRLREPPRWGDGAMAQP
jgi:hypothetical protein